MCSRTWTRTSPMKPAERARMSGMSGCAPVGVVTDDVGSLALDQVKGEQQVSNPPTCHERIVVECSPCHSNSDSLSSTDAGRLTAMMSVNERK